MRLYLVEINGSRAAVKKALESGKLVARNTSNGLGGGAGRGLARCQQRIGPQALLRCRSRQHGHYPAGNSGSGRCCQTPLPAQAEKAAKAELRKIKEEIQAAGDRPEGMNTPQGDKIFDTFNIYGGGDCFVVGEEHIWYVQNNGMDGDDWDLNNVKTGGAGAIGWRVARTDELIGRLQKLQGVLK